MKIFDSHTHAVIPEFCDTYNQKGLTGYLGIRTPGLPMDDVEFYKMANSMPNYYVLEYVDYYEGFDFHFDRIKKLYENHKDKIVGIKFYPGYDPVYPNDERLHKFYDFAQDNNLVVVYHNGIVADDEHMASLKYAHPIEVDDVANAYPNLKIVISHLGFPFMMDAATVVMKNNNVYTCFSGIIESDGLATEELQKDLARILKYYPTLVDKLLFGTDYFGEDSDYNNLEYYKKMTESLFSGEKLEKIYYKNACELYNISLK